MSEELTPPVSPVPPVRATKGSTPDGPRYVAAIRSEPNLDSCLYKDFYESEVGTDAIEEANDRAMDTGFATLVFDRKNQEIVHRFNPVAAAAAADEEDRKRKRK